MPENRTNLKFKVGVSRLATGKSGYQQNKYEFGNSFHTEQHTLDPLMRVLTVSGYPVTMVHHRQAPGPEARKRKITTFRHTENFISQQILLLDDDRGEPGVVAEWLADPFFSQYGAFFYESASSGQNKERGRAVFILDHPLDDTGEVTEAIKSLMGYYPHVDQVPSDAARVWYGAPKTNTHRLGNILPYAILEEKILQPYRKKIAAEKQKKEVEAKARWDEWQKAKAEGRVKTDTDSIAKFLINSLDGIFDWVARQRQGRHKALLWGGRKIGSLQAAGWTSPHAILMADADSRIIAACKINDYWTDYRAFAHFFRQKPN